MAEDMDKFIKSTLQKRYTDVKNTLEIYKNAIENMVELLYEEENITGEQVKDIIRSYELENNLPTRLEKEKKNV